MYQFNFMKQVAIALSIIFLALSASAQVPAGVPTQKINGWIQNYYTVPDSGTVVPRRDTAWVPSKFGMTITWPRPGADTTQWIWIGSHWIQDGTGSAIDTGSLSSRINQKLNISDTAAMLLPYLKKVDTTNKWVQNVYSRNDSLFKHKNGSESFIHIFNTTSSGTVTSVGLSMPSAFTVTNSPITGSGTIGVSGAGTTLQYIRGNGTLATFDTTAIPNFYVKVKSLITPPGSNTQVIYNNAGAFGASPSFTFNSITKSLTVADDLGFTSVFGAGSIDILTSDDVAAPSISIINDAASTLQMSIGGSATSSPYAQVSGVSTDLLIQASDRVVLGGDSVLVRGVIKSSADSLWAVGPYNSAFGANTMYKIANSNNPASQQEGIWGVIYQSAAFSSLSGFTNNGATVSATGGHLAFSGGNPYNQSLDLDSSRAIENWVVGAKIKITAAGVGPGIGMRGNTAGGPNSAIITFNTNTGKIALISGATTQVAIATDSLPFSIGDTIELMGELDKTVLTGTVRNLTTNGAAAVISYNYLLNSSAVFLPNTAKFAIFNGGGSFEVDSFGVFSKVSINPDIVLVGDSKHRGYNATTEGYRVGDQLNNNYRSCVILSGLADKLEDMIRRSWEIIYISGPRTKVILGGCSNNIRAGQSSSTYNQLYDSLVTILTNAGLNVFHITGLYETGINQNTFRSHIYSTYSASKIIETLIPTNQPRLLSSDNIHLNDSGQIVEYNAILQSVKIPAYTTFDAGNTVIRNQQKVYQSANFKILGTGIMDGRNVAAFANTLKITNVATLSNFINMNINHATNHAELAFSRQDTAWSIWGLGTVNANPHDLGLRHDAANFVIGTSSGEHVRFNNNGDVMIGTTTNLFGTRLAVTGPQYLVNFSSNTNTGVNLQLTKPSGTWAYVGVGGIITGQDADALGIRSDKGIIDFANVGAKMMTLNAGQMTLQSYASGFGVNDTTTYKPLVINSSGVVYRMTVWPVTGSSQTWQQTLTTGSVLTGNNTITGANTNFTWNDMNTFTINSDLNVLAKADGTIPYSSIIAGSGNIYEFGYTPVAGTFSKGAGIIIDTNNNSSLGASIPTSAPLYAAGNSVFLNGMQNQAGNFCRVDNVSSNITAGLAQYFFSIDASGGNVTITLPAASTAFGSSMGIKYVFQRVDASGNTVTISRAGSDTINGATSFTLGSQWETKNIQCTSATTWAQN